MSPIILHAGLLQMALFPEDGSLRYIMAGEFEVLRGISAPVRDQAWATIRPEITELKVEQKERSFHVTYVARCRNDDVDFRWKAKLTGSDDGVLVFDFEGEALNDFLRNRIGFCILHPADLAGAACSVEHTDGSIEHGSFPTAIRTGSPFADIRSITHPVAAGVSVMVDMQGETFEMEDQRNWTDASFKTFCTPLAQPRPVQIAKGTRIQQRVTVGVVGSIPPPRVGFTPPWTAPQIAEVSIGAPLASKLPEIGVVWNDPDTTSAVISALRPLSLAHLRVNLWLNDPDYRKLLESASEAAKQLGAGLEIAVYAGDDAPNQFRKLRSELGALAHVPALARWLVFHEAKDATPPETVTAAREAFGPTRYAAPFGGGGASDSFAELNYNRGIAQSADFTVHACNPQVHAFDEASIVETIAIQALTARDARSISGERPVVISPITLTRRWRPNDFGVPAGRPRNVLPYQADTRHGSEFTAAWMLGSLAALSAEGVTSMTYFEATGENGLFSNEGEPRPIVKVFTALSALGGATVSETTSTHPLYVSALALNHGGQQVVLLANLRGASQSVRVTGKSGNRVVQLPGYAVSSVSVE
jgi:hypothetical protein